MASKKSSNSTRPSRRSNGLVGFLRAQLVAANAREKELLRQLAAKDDQIRLVLEEKFFHPVVTRPEEAQKANTAVEPESFNDSVQFPTKGDAEEITKQDAAIEKARSELYAELAALEAEQVAAHEPHYENLPLEAKAEDVAVQERAE